jgi:hypothetical protein
VLPVNLLKYGRCSGEDSDEVASDLSPAVVPAVAAAVQLTSAADLASTFFLGPV